MIVNEPGMADGTGRPIRWHAVAHFDSFSVVVVSLALLQSVD
jgi:hypothetical protein